LRLFPARLAQDTAGYRCKVKLRYIVSLVTDQPYPKQEASFSAVAAAAMAFKKFGKDEISGFTQVKASVARGIRCE
jgi:hypothetical protein